MELIIPFRKTDYSAKGTNLKSGNNIFEDQEQWEESFREKFNPLYANVLEGHPLAMKRLTDYYDFDPSKNYDFGMELIDGEIDIDTNLEIEEFSEYETIYAIGSRILLDDEGDGEPIFLVKNDNLSEDILVLKYVPDDEDDEDSDRTEVPSDEKHRVNA